MKSIFFTVLFAIVSATNAQTTPQPNWVLLDSSDATDTFVDKSSLRRTGDVVTAWQSYVSKQKKLSIKILKEFNCKTKQHRRLSGTVFSKMNFTGDTISMPKEDWEYIVRDSFGEDVLNYVCKNAPKGLMDYFK